MAEHDTNWSDVYMKVLENDVSVSVNVDRLHVAYKAKKDQKERKALEGKICPHGNGDEERHIVRKDYSNSDLFNARIPLSIIMFF